MRHLISTRVPALAVAALLTAACQAEKAPPPTEAAAQPPAADATAAAVVDDNDLLATTCADYLTAARIADPGKDPSDERKAEAIEAQDAMVDTMSWAHGYQTGRSGSVAAAKPLTKAWMVENVSRLAEICEKNSIDGSMRLAEAVAKL